MQESNIYELWKNYIHFFLSFLFLLLETWQGTFFRRNGNKLFKKYKHFIFYLFLQKTKK